jgi:CheY-like chemotaxis protein
MIDDVRILLVDDDANERALVRDELCRAFERAVVVEIANAAQLAEALDGPKAQLVITDHALGWSDGLTVLRQVKRGRRDRDRRRWDRIPRRRGRGAGRDPDISGSSRCGSVPKPWGDGGESEPSPRGNTRGVLASRRGERRR